MIPYSIKLLFIDCFIEQFSMI